MRLHTRVIAALASVVSIAACNRTEQPQPAGAANERPGVAAPAPAPAELVAAVEAPAPAKLGAAVEAPTRADAPPVAAPGPGCPRARDFERRACDHLRPRLCADQSPCTVRCDLLPRTPQIDLESCDPDGFVVLRSAIVEGSRGSARWIGHVSADRSWLLDQPLIIHPWAPVIVDIPYAYTEDPAADGRPIGAVFGLEGSVEADGGPDNYSELSFEAEITCRVRDVPTCTAPLATRYAWSGQTSGQRATDASAYTATLEEDDPGEHLLVKVAKRSIARDDPARDMGLALLSAGKHPYKGLLQRELIALEPR